MIRVYLPLSDQREAIFVEGGLQYLFFFHPFLLVYFPLILYPILSFQFHTGIITWGYRMNCLATGYRSRYDIKAFFWRARETVFPFIEVRNGWH